MKKYEEETMIKIDTKISPRSLAEIIACLVCLMIFGALLLGVFSSETDFNLAVAGVRDSVFFWL